MPYLANMNVIILQSILLCPLMGMIFTTWLYAWGYYDLSTSIFQYLLLLRICLCCSFSTVCSKFSIFLVFFASNASYEYFISNRFFNCWFAWHADSAIWFKISVVTRGLQVCMISIKLFCQIIFLDAARIWHKQISQMFMCCIIIHHVSHAVIHCRPVEQQSW